MSKTGMLYQRGSQSKSDPFKFVMSTDKKSRTNDIVVQDWNLSEFNANPIALWMHDDNVPIGTWADLEQESVGLTGWLKLADPGTSEFLDTTRKLVEQRVLRAVSVGWVSNKATPLDEENPFAGYRLAGNVLYECSLASIPANPDAIRIAQKLHRQARKLFFSAPRETFVCDEPAYKQLGIAAPNAGGTQPSGTPGPTPPNRQTASKGKSNSMSMNRSEKISTLKQEIGDLRNSLAGVESQYDDCEVAEERDVLRGQIQAYNAQIDDKQRDLDLKLEVEKRMQMRAGEGDSAQQQVQQAGGSGPVQHIETRKNRAPAHYATGAMACLFKAHCTSQDPLRIASIEMKDDPEIKHVIQTAVPGAVTTVDAWAGNLVRESWGELVELLHDISIYYSLPGTRVEFGQFGAIPIPVEEGRGELSGGFVDEAAPIPVAKGTVGLKRLTEKEVAIISYFSKKLGRHSIPSIQAMMQRRVMSDTAETLDALYMDATAESTTRPAGMQDTTETGAGNINASSGTSVAQINADTTAMIGRALAARSGNTFVWAMNPIRVLGLRNVQDAASGVFPYRQEIASGMFQGYPIISSQNMPTDLVELQSDSAVIYGNDYGPTIDVNDSATLVASDAPTDVVTDAGAVSTEHTVSLFQTQQVAVKLTMGLDWRIVRIGGVQMLTGVAW